jgi:hypothetical protein
MSPVASVAYVQFEVVLYRTKPELSNNALCAPLGRPETLGRTRSELRPSLKSQEQSCQSAAEPVKSNLRCYADMEDGTSA